MNGVAEVSGRAGIEDGGQRLNIGHSRGWDQKCRTVQYGDLRRNKDVFSNYEAFSPESLGWPSRLFHVEDSHLLV